MHSITGSLRRFSRLFLCICDTVRRRESAILSREIALCKSYYNYYCYSDHNNNSGRSAPMCELGVGGGGGGGHGTRHCIDNICFPGGLAVGTTAKTFNCQVSICKLD